MRLGNTLVIKNLKVLSMILMNNSGAVTGHDPCFLSKARARPKDSHLPYLIRTTHL
jgi:hypothetical protein